jgi:predicted nucleotidyltransferase
MLTTVDIEKINGFAIARKAVIAIYIFGSSATGKELPGCDIDLAVMFACAFWVWRALKWKRRLW